MPGVILILSHLDVAPCVFQILLGWISKFCYPSFGCSFPLLLDDSLIKWGWRRNLLCGRSSFLHRGVGCGDTSRPAFLCFCCPWQSFCIISGNSASPFFAFSWGFAGVVWAHHPSRPGRWNISRPRKPGAASWVCFLIVSISTTILEGAEVNLWHCYGQALFARIRPQLPGLEVQWRLVPAPGGRSR